MSAPSITIDACANLPTAWGTFRLETFTFHGTGESHLVLSHEPDPQAVPLVRLHSECSTGDVFGSLRCDCGPQLHAALARVGRSDRGYVLYLRQEGRGIGLEAKLRAYNLQEQGHDTIEANLRLGLPIDARRYDAAAAFLHARGVRQLRLLTNNPDKLAALRGAGFDVIREPLVVDPNPHNVRYMQTKRLRMGHMVDASPLQ